MNLTVYSLIMAIIWFDIFVLLGILLQRKLCLFMNYNLYPIILLIVLSLIRLFAPVETPQTIVIQSWVIAPAIQRTLKLEVAVSESASLPVFEMVIFIATVVSVILLVRFFWACWNECQMIEGFVQTEDCRLLGLMDDIVQKTKPGQTYRLCVLNQNVSPAICGLMKPVIILPGPVAKMKDLEVSHILMHEWQHHLEKDLWVKLFIGTVCCVMWWNPVVYLLKKDIDQTLELKCDLKITEGLNESERLDYLSALLKVARIQQLEQKQAVAIYFTGSTTTDAEAESNVWQRFQAVIKCGERNRKIEAVSMTCLLLLFLVSFRFVVQPCFPPQMEDMGEFADQRKDAIDVYQITPENAYIVAKEEGEYWLYVNDKFVRALSQGELHNQTHRNLPIVKEE